MIFRGNENGLQLNKMANLVIRFAAVVYFVVTTKTGSRSGPTALFSNILGFTALLFAGLSPGLVFVCLSTEYSRYSFPFKSVFN